MKRVFAFGLTTVLLLTGVISCHFQRSYTLEGYVYESFSKTPLPGITIQCANLSAITNKDGFFQITPLPEKKVPILVGKHKNYTDLTDTLLLDQKVSHRDFVLDAKHPLGIDLSTYIDPSSYFFSYHTVIDKKTPTSLFSGRSVPIDETLELIGKFSESIGKWKKVEVVQIGLSFFEKDEYNNWNESSKPNVQALQFQSDARDLIQKAYHFFEDPMLSFEESKAPFSIEGVQTVLYLVKEIGSEENKRQYEVYLVKDGIKKGQVKKVIRYSNPNSSLPGQVETSLILSQWNEMFQIFPPKLLNKYLAFLYSSFYKRHQ